MSGPRSAKHAPSFAEDLAVLRSQLLAKAAELHLVQASPRTPDEIQNAVRAYVSAAEMEAREHFVPESLAADVPGNGNLPAVFRANVLGGLAIVVGADALTKALAAEATKAAGATDQIPLSSAERVAKRDRIDSEIFDLEIEEEILIRRAEIAGVTLARRADVRPEIVLAGTLEDA